MGFGYAQKGNVMKKVLLLSIILIAITFCGCTTVSIERRINKDSSIEDIITVTYDSQTAQSYGYTDQDIKEVVTHFGGLNGYEFLSQESGIIKVRRYYATHAEFEESIPKGEDESPTRDGFFIDEYKTTSNTPYKLSLSNGFDQKVLEGYFSNIPQELLNNITYEYKYTTPYDNITSNGIVSKNNGYYTHSWQWDREGVDVEKIEIIQTVPDATGWYLVSIVAVGVIVGIGYLIIGIMKGKEGEEDDG